MNFKNLIIVILTFLTCLITVFSLLDIPEFRIPFEEFKKIIEETNSPNAVTAYYLNYRLYDTMFEVFVFTLSVYGVVFFLNSVPSLEKHTPFSDPVMTFYARFAFALSILSAVYIAIVGHLSPGGGFVAGIVAGTGMMLVSLTKTIDEIEKSFKISKISNYEKITLLVVVLIVIFPVLMGKKSFQNFLPLGETGKIFSAGFIPLFDLLIFLKVMFGSWSITFYFIKHRGVV
ncbi:MAG: multicomponent Na+:H+ antiporter subunit [Thermotogaceae bacterium]|nr:multicomponent Na+:H+ antiporter subunit [Thermotogaceae bacterium]MDN5337947.1 multicomponent Na+:H+ antiporter subunit [Thermotogaceae bacterium]